MCCHLWSGCTTLLFVWSSPKACWIFRIVSTWVSASFWQNLMQYRCSSHSVIFGNWQSDERSQHLHSHRPTAGYWRFLQAGKNLRMRTNVPSTSTMMDTSRAWFVYAGKIKVRYLLNSPCTLKLLSKPHTKYIFLLWTLNELKECDGKNTVLTEVASKTALQVCMFGGFLKCFKLHRQWQKCILALGNWI